MTPAEYLDAAKAAMNIKSDYELAVRLEWTRGMLSQARHGQRAIPSDIAYRIAITLNLDPAQVWAEIESQQEKNPRRAAFWRSFLARAAVVAAVCCTLASSFTAGVEIVPGAAGGRRRQFA